MGIGSSLKKFVKKVAPIAAPLAGFIPGVGPMASAAIGALGGVIGGGGVKEALLGGLGGYAAGGFGQGIRDAGGFAKLLQGPGGGIANVLKTGFGGIRSTPLGQGIGGIFNKFTGAGQAAAAGAPIQSSSGQFSSSYTPTQTSYLDAAADLGHGPPRGISDYTVDAATGKFSGMPSSKYSDIAMDAATGKFSGSPGADTDEGNLFGNIVDQYNVATEGEGTKSGFMDFVTNMFNERNLPLTAGILGGLAQMFENKQNEGAGDVTLGEGLDYYTDGRGVLTGLANGGRIGFADGDEVRDAEYEGWKQMYEKNPEVAMMMHGNSAEYLEKYNKEMELNSKAKGGIIGLANGGEPTMEMDYRGGGFIPVGAKERADDVPARLSKNEFVMTADAVRAAGGGSIEKGSQRMYDLMNSLEAQA